MSRVSFVLQVESERVSFVLQVESERVSFVLQVESERVSFVLQVESERGLFNEGGLQMVVPLRSLPMITEMPFAVSKTNHTPFCDYNLLDEDGLSTLLTCTSCNVCVHASK